MKLKRCERMRWKIVDEKEGTYCEGRQQVDSDITCKIQKFNLRNLCATLFKLVLCTVGEELSAGVNNFLAEVLILGESHKKS